MTKYLRLLVAVVGLGLAAPFSTEARQPQEQQPPQEQRAGLMRHILRDGRSLTLTYYPIDDLKGYIDQVLIEKKKPDVKTGNETVKVKVLLDSDEEVTGFLNAVQKEGYAIAVFVPGSGGIYTLWRLEPKHFGSKQFKAIEIDLLKP